MKIGIVGSRRYENKKKIKDTSFYTERGFASIEDADSYATLLRKQEPDYVWCLFEQIKVYENGEDKK